VKKTIQILAIFAEDKQGRLNRVSKLLADNSLNIRHVAIADSNTGAYGVMKFLVDDPARALDLLRQNGLLASHVEALAVAMPDRPGSLHAIADILDRAGLNIASLSGMVVGSQAILLIETDKLPSAIAALESASIPVLSRDELLKL
jgi:hypothetical protein